MQVISKTKNKMKVQYDNGDDEVSFSPCLLYRLPKFVTSRPCLGAQDVHIDHVSPIETLPVEFGEEEESLQVSPAGITHPRPLSHPQTCMCHSAAGRVL